MRTSNELQIGKAGEYIVCADLILKGFIAYPSEQGLPYDIVLDTGKKLLKCQVKTTQKPRAIPQRAKETHAYIFNIKKNGNGGKGRYSKEEIDFFALVELETKKVVYLKADDLPETINLRVDRLKGTYYDEKGVKNYHSVMELNSKGFSMQEISKALNINYSTVSRMLKDDYKPFETNARYFLDLEKDKDWFLVL